ncbi:MAG: c-type cytochrome [Euzebya sp.]
MQIHSSLLRVYAGWFLVIGIAVAVAFLVFQPAGAQEEESLSNPIAFAEQSYANVCAACHGAEGTGGIVPGTDREAPALRGRDDVTAAYIDLVLRTGRMPPAGDPFDNRAREVFYTDAERQAMVDYTSQLFDLEDDIPEVSDGNIALGLEAFALNCAHCHGNSGNGGTAGENAWTPRVNNIGPIAVAEAIRVGPLEMPQFSADVLSQREVDSIASYLQAVEDEPGTPVLGLVELNPVFASGFVGLLAIVLLGSLLFIGGRPVPFEASTGEEVPTAIHAPDGMTPMPDDPTDQQDVVAEDEDPPA